MRSRWLRQVASLLLLQFIPHCSCWLIDPLSAAVSVASSLAANYLLPDMINVRSMLESVRCSATDRLGECCRPPWVQMDVSKLERLLESQVFGQHVVKNVLVKSLKARKRRDEPNKALVLSFHGGTGVGKNYVARFLAESMYREGLHSKYVHLYLGTLHFPHQDRIEEYTSQLQAWIRGNVSECAQSLFIFDEIDKAPDGLFDALKPFIDFHQSVDNVDYRRATFVFLSNTGGEAINDLMIKRWKSGHNRDEANYGDFEELMARGAFNERGGLHYSVVIQKVLVDHFVPFLPLERKHIRQCAQDYAVNYRKRRLSDEQLEAVLSRMVFKPREEQLFSATGCKRVGQIVDLIMEDDE